jgi:hypothetical protein
MSDKKHTDSKFSEYFRYLDDQMSNAERYRFERSLERDPFEAEAFEGISEFKLKDVDRDLSTIDVLRGKRSISWTTVRKYLYVAAGIAVIVGLAFLIPTIPFEKFAIKRSIKPVPETTDILAQEITDDTTNLEDSTEIILAEATSISEEDALAMQKKQAEEKARKDLLVQQQKEKKSHVPTVVFDAADIAEDQSMSLVAEKQETRAHTIIEPGKVLYRGRIVSSQDKTPVVGATILLKGTKNGTSTNADGSFEIQVAEEAYPLFNVQYLGMNAKDIILDKNQNITIAMEPSLLALQEVAVTSKSTTSGPSAEPQPHGGMTLYRQYLEKNQIYPKTIEKQGRETVRVKFRVSLSGEPFDIQVVKSPNEAFTFEATRLVLEGPKWSPAVKDGKPTIGEVDLRITFKP